MGVWDPALYDNSGAPCGDVREAPSECFAWTCKPCPERGECIGDEVVVCNDQSYLTNPQYPHSTEQMCTKCPLGATCPSGKSVIVFIFLILSSPWCLPRGF